MLSSRTWPWYMLGIVLGFFVAGSLASMVEQSTISVESAVVTINSDGPAGDALLIYHPGVTRFNRRVTYAYAEGLADSGWRCDVSTASGAAPTDLEEYELLVLGTPTYFSGPARSIVEYVGLLGDLGGIPTTIIVTAGSGSDLAAMKLEAVVLDANGTVTGILELWQMRPNAPRYGTSDAMEIARRAGSSRVVP